MSNDTQVDLAKAGATLVFSVLLLMASLFLICIGAFFLFLLIVVI